MPARGDFVTESDDQAETLLRDIDFDKSDSADGISFYHSCWPSCLLAGRHMDICFLFLGDEELYRSLDFTVVDIYRHRVLERAHKKRYIILYINARCNNDLQMT